MPTPSTILYAGEPRPLPPSLRNSHLMRYEASGGSLANLGKSPATEAVKLACAVLALPGEPEAHADLLPPLPELIEALTPLIETIAEKKAPAAGLSPLPAPGTPGA